LPQCRIDHTPGFPPPPENPLTELPAQLPATGGPLSPENRFRFYNAFRDHDPFRHYDLFGH